MTEKERLPRNPKLVEGSRVPGLERFRVGWGGKPQVLSETCLGVSLGPDSYVQKGDRKAGTE